MLELCRFLKKRNCESRFILPLSEIRNCVSIHFTIILANNSGQRPKPVKESELRFFWNRNRHSPNSHDLTWRRRRPRRWRGRGRGGTRSSASPRTPRPSPPRGPGSPCGPAVKSQHFRHFWRNFPQKETNIFMHPTPDPT